MNPKAKLGLAVVAGLVLGLGGAGLYLRSRPPASAEASAPGSTPPMRDLLIAQRTKGDSTAPITVFEVSDFQCPFCRQFWADTKSTLDQEYIRTGKVKFVFINFPIPAIHRNATAAHV